MKAGIRQQLWILFGLFLLTGATVLVVDEFAQYQARQSLLVLRGQSLLGLREIKSVSDAYGLEVVDTTFRTRNYLIPWEEGEASSMPRARASIAAGRRWRSCRARRKRQRTSAPPRGARRGGRGHGRAARPSWRARTSRRSATSPTRACTLDRPGDAAAQAAVRPGHGQGRCGRSVTTCVPTAGSAPCASACRWPRWW
jgi:hypothetical protein